MKHKSPPSFLPKTIVSYCFIFLVTLYSSLFAQDESKIDSLKKFSETSIENKHLANILLDISLWHAERVEEDSAIYYSNRALHLSEKLGLDTLIAKSYYCTGLAYDYGGNLQAALDNYEMARQGYEKLDITDEVISSMNSKGVAAYYQGDYQAALDYYLKTLSYVENTQDDDQLVNVLNNIGVIYRITNQNE